MEFEDESSIEKAKKLFDNQDFMGRTIYVDLSKGRGFGGRRDDRGGRDRSRSRSRGSHRRDRDDRHDRDDRDRYDHRDHRRRDDSRSPRR